MFGAAGHLYTYFVYGMHWCANIVTGQVGVASAVLLRSGEVLAGLDLARSRRPGQARDRLLARGPAGLATCLGLAAGANGADLCAPAGWIGLFEGSPPAAAVRTGPRVGVAVAADLPLRYWIDGDPTVSAYRAWTPRRRTPAGARALTRHRRPPARKRARDGRRSGAPGAARAAG